MGLRGQAPTPTEILKLRGSTLVSGRAGDVEFERETPACPAWLGREARAEWRRQVKHLEKAGLVQVVDRSALALYCESWGEVYEITLAIRAKGGVGACPVSLLYAKNAAADRCLRLATHFGFSPSARARLKAPEQASAKDEDPFEALMKKKA